MSKTERSAAGASLHLDRREFIAAAGAAAVVAALPLAESARAAGTPLAAESCASAASVGASAPLADWTIDDMWGVYPRYADPIGYGRPHAEPDLQALADPADLGLLA